MGASRKRKAVRRLLALVAGLLAVSVVAFLVYFPGQQSLLAVTLATGLGIDRLQARVDAIEEKAIQAEPSTDADKRFLHNLYTCFAKGAVLTPVLRQSGRLMAHYLARTGEPLRIEPQIFLGSRKVQGQMDLLREKLADDLRIRGTLAEEYAAEAFHMGEPEFLDAAVSLYIGRISVCPRVFDGDRVLLHWRADMLWQWPSYESLYERYGDYHAQCFPLPNARSLLQGPEYYLWMDNGLGENLARLGLAQPFLAWSDWQEEIWVAVAP